MKRVITILLFISVMCIQNDCWSQEKVLIGDLYYVLNYNGNYREAEVTYGPIPYLLSSISIPETINYFGDSYKVTAIGDGAFQNSNVSTVFIPNSVSMIGGYAFEYTKLTEIDIPNSVTAIGGNAFRMTNLLSVAIPNSVTYMGRDAFGDCEELTTVSIGNGLSSISYGCFAGCYKLTSVNIPNSVETIEQQAFYYCSSLSSITIPKSVKVIGTRAFSGTGITSLIIPSGVTKIDGAFITNSKLVSIHVDEGNPVYDSRNNCNAVIETLSNTIIQGSNETVIPSDVINIGDFAFYQFTSLSSIIIPNGLLNIGKGAFEYCSSLNSIEIPNSIINIGEHAFTGCKALNNISVGSENTKYDSRDNCNAIIEKSTNTLIQGCNNTQIPNSVNTIGELAFEGYHGITNMIIPEGVTDIKVGAFSNCINLISVILPNSLINIGNDAFSVTGLKSVLLPNGVVNVGRSAFQQSESLSSLQISKNVKYINNQAFYRCPLTSIKVYAENPPNIESMTFSDYSAKLHVLKGCKSRYQSVDYWKNFINIIDDLTTDNPDISEDKGKLIVRVKDVIREYGEDNPQFIITYTGFQDGDDESVVTTHPTVSTTATKTSNVGEYPITISGGSATNYEFVYEPGVLTVTKAPLSAKVNDATKIYGAQNPAFTINYYGLKNNESTPAWTTSPTFQTDATQASGVGAYTVKAVNGVPVNYDLGEITTGTLNITPAPLTIKANDAVRQYYSDNPTFSYTCNGFVNGENESVLVTAPKLSTTATRTSSVGTYEIKVGDTSSPNYSISFVNATLTITPRTLMASVDNYERPYNVENPVFEVKYDGFVGDDDDKVLISKPEAKTTATKTSDVGTYPINVTGGSADNYTFTYTSGILTINKAEQTISWEQDLSALSVDDQVELKAEASSGLPITYTMDQTNIAEIYTAGNKTYLDCKGEGTFQIVAVQNGNKNYYSSTRVRKTITIGNSSGINEMDNSQVKVKRTSYGIKVIDANVGDVICIYTLDGLLQHSVKVESKNVEIPLNRQNVYIIKVGGKIVKLGFNPSE